MKVIKYLTLTLILFLSAMVLFAETDGTILKETTVKVVLDANTLIPQILQIAYFDEAEIEHITILLMDMANKFSPVMPKEADFEDGPEERDSFSPAVPLEAPYSEFL